VGVKLQFLFFKIIHLRSLLCKHMVSQIVYIVNYGGELF